MPRQAASDAPDPNAGSVRAAAQQVEGLLDGDGHFNPDPDQLSRGHPDYDEADDPRASEDRDEKGRFKAKKAAPDDIDDDEEVDDADEADDSQQAAGDDSDEDTADSEDGDADEDLAASAVDDDDADDQETDAIESVAQLAEALGVTQDELAEAVTDTFTAAGEEVTVTLAELRQGYLKDADYRQSTAKLAEDRKQFVQDSTTRLQAFDKAAHEQAAQLSAFENVLVEQLRSPEMEQLRQSDQAEWLARREEIGQRVNFIRQAREAAKARYDEQQTEYLKGLRENAMTTLKESIPDYSTKHAETAKTVMQSVGYTDEEISKIFDPRIVTAALELHSLRSENAKLKEEQTKATDAVKRVKKATPRFVKSGKGKARSKSAIKRSEVQRLQGRLSKSGKVEDAAKVIEHFI